MLLIDRDMIPNYSFSGTLQLGEKEKAPTEIRVAFWDDIKMMPVINSDNLIKHGKWTSVYYSGPDQREATGTCSCCKSRGSLRTDRNEWGFWYVDTPYCPVCGAKMDIKD